MTLSQLLAIQFLYGCWLPWTLIVACAIGEARQETQEPAPTEQPAGKVFDGHRIKTIRENQKHRVEFRNRIREHVAGLFGSIAGLFGIPHKILAALGAACGLCCVGLGVLFASVLIWAGVSLARRK